MTAPETLPLPEPKVRTLCVECGECFHAERGEEVCRVCESRVVREGIR